MCRQKKEARACQLLSDLGNEWMDYEVIGIDEGQFFADVINFKRFKIQIVNSFC
jgi:hypothetical protein